MPRKQSSFGQPAVYNSSAPTYSDGESAALQVDASGNLLTGASAGAGTVGDGRKVVATAGTAEALAASTACKSVIITAETDNTGLVVVGASTVAATLATRRGTPLNAGDSISIDVANLSSVYLDVTVSGDGVTYTYVN